MAQFSLDLLYRVRLEIVQQRYCIGIGALAATLKNASNTDQRVIGINITAVYRVYEANAAQ